MISDIYKFQKEVIKLSPPLFPVGLEKASFQWLLSALKEEIDEFEKAKYLSEQVDALIDLCYFAIGGLARMGLTEDQAKACFEAVHKANMTKKPGVISTRENDGSVTDAIKPSEFVDPTQLIEEILRG